MASLLGIDVGTSGSRVVIVNEDGRVAGVGDSRARAVHVAENCVGRTGAGGLVARQPRGDTRGTEEEPEQSPARFAPSVSPARCTAACCWMRTVRSCGRPSSGAISGPRRNAGGSPKRSARLACSTLTSNPALTNFTLPKLLWVRAHEPECVAARSPCAAAEGFRPPAAQRRICHRRRRRVGHADARRRAPPVVAGECSRRQGSIPAVLPRVFESPEICARVSSKRGGRNRTARGDADRRGRRRSGCRRDRNGDHSPGRGQRHDRNVGSGVRRDRSPGARSEGTPSHVLSRDSGSLARDGCHAGGGSVAALAPRAARTGAHRETRLTR